MRPSARLFRLPVIGGVGVVAFLLTLALWPSSVTVDLATATRGPLRVTVDDEAETRVRRRFTVSAPVTGQVLRIDLQAGDAVRAGVTELATVLPAQPAPLDARSHAEARAAVAAAAAARGAADADLARALTARRLADAELARSRGLAADQVVSPQTLEVKEAEARTAADAVRAAEFGAAAARHQHDMARARLLQAGGGAVAGREYRVLSPVDGVVLRRLRESEGVVTAGQPLLEIGDLSDLELVSDLLSSDAVRVRPGAAVLVERWGGPTPLAARVRRVEPSGFTKVSALGVEEQRVNVVMDFEGPAASRPGLGDGYRVDVRIFLWEGDTLTVPAAALFRHGQEWAAFVCRDNRAELRVVRVGHRSGTDAEVTDGLSAGELVVLHPPDTLRPGARVRRAAGPPR